MDLDNPRDRDILGNIVRVAWQMWAREQPDIDKRPDWLTPYDQLEERFKEVDRRIGTMIYSFAQGMLDDTPLTIDSPLIIQGPDGAYTITLD